MKMTNQEQIGIMYVSKINTKTLLDYLMTLDLYEINRGKMPTKYQERKDVYRTR